MESPLESHRRRRRASHFSRCQVSPTDAHRRLFSLLSSTLVSNESTIFASWHTIHDRGESTMASHQHKQPFTTVSRSRTGHPLDRMDELFAFCSVDTSLTASPPSSTIRALLNAVVCYVMMRPGGLLPAVIVRTHLRRCDLGQLPDGKMHCEK